MDALSILCAASGPTLQSYKPPINIPNDASGWHILNIIRCLASINWYYEAVLLPKFPVFYAVNWRGVTVNAGIE